MNDDELGRFLQSEVPEPGAGYWDEIDRRLHQAAAESDASTGPHVEQVSDVEEISGIGETDDNVIRLTDMNQTILPQKQSVVPMVLAAAAAVLLVVAGYSVFRNSNTTLSTEVGPADQRTDDNGATGGDNGSATGADADATADQADPAPIQRICYTGRIESIDGAPAGEASVWVERDGDAARFGILLETEGFQDIAVGDGVIDGDGVLTGTTRSTNGIEDQVDTLVVTDENLGDTEAPIDLPAVPCDQVARQMEAIDQAAAELENGSTGESNAQAVTFGEEPARVWTVVNDGPVEVRASPNDPNSVVATVADGVLLGGAGGVATTDDDVRWISTYLRLPVGTVTFGWVREGDVTATDWTGWLCFSSDNPRSVLAFDPSAPADTPLGAFVMMPGEDPLENEPQVSVIATAPADNPEEIGDELPVYVQVGDGWETQTWAQTSFGVAGQDLSWEPVSCDQVGEGLAYIEAFRTDIELP